MPQIASWWLGAGDGVMADSPCLTNPEARGKREKYSGFGAVILAVAAVGRFQLSV